VKRSTGGSQQPWVSSSPIDGSFYFVPAPAVSNAPAVGTAPPATNEAASAWSATQNTTSVAVLEDFVRQFGSTIYGSMARARLDELKNSKAAVVAPPVQAAALAPPTQRSSPCGGPKSSVNFSLSSRTPKPLSTTEECALKPKDIFQECDKCPEMVMLQAGSFTMGSPPNDANRSDREGPQHRVNIAQPFAVAKFATTVDQFAVFVTETGHDMGPTCRTLEGGKTEERQGRSWRDPGFTQSGSHPVVCINFGDAKAYVNWLSAKTSKTYRLLTEGEWEFAARAGTSTRYYFGDDEKDICRYGNGADVAAKEGAGLRQSAACNDGYTYTAPVGKFLPNAFGLYDMHGNVRQWVEDCFHDSYSGAPTDGSTWTSADCSLHVQRGGAWGYAPTSLRSASRDGIEPTLRRSFTGFRVARTL
jgi:formylglycine-generating enzyme required for sulfatase activity